MPRKGKLYCHVSGGGMGTSSRWHCRSPAFLSSIPLALSGVVIPGLGLLNLALLGAQQSVCPNLAVPCTETNGSAELARLVLTGNQYPCCKSACHAALMEGTAFPLSKSCL